MFLENPENEECDKNVRNTGKIVRKRNGGVILHFGIMTESKQQEQRS